MGALAVLTDVVSIKSLEAALLARIPPGTEEKNRKALAAGLALARTHLQGKAAPPGEPR